MSFVIAAPQTLASTASDLGGIASMITEANAMAAVRTTALMPAAGDEVSAAIASLFASHAQAYQSLSAQAATFHEQFVQALNSAGNWYAAAETANAAMLQTVEQDVLGLINAPTNTLVGRPLIGGGTRVVSVRRPRTETQPSKPLITACACSTNQCGSDVARPHSSSVMPII